MNRDSSGASRETTTVLVVDDDPGMVDFLVEMLAAEGFATQGTSSPKQALLWLTEQPFDLVLADVEMPEMRGTELLAAALAQRPEQLVVLMTAFGTIDLAVQAVRSGAADFVTKPFRVETLVLVLDRALRERRMRREIVRLRASAGADLFGVVAKSPSMKRVVELAARAARSEAPVLITGESGVGKGLVARAIAQQSARSSGPFVQVNCAALPGPLVEAELFGVKRGAYTDAREDRAGLFTQANGGTLFLDEIGEMPIESQPKLLQVIESGRVRPVGGQREEPVSVRIIAATNQALPEAIRERRFREDLFYRLNVIPIEIPPLRHRPEDINALVDAFLQRTTTTTGRPVLGVSARAMQHLLSHQWPGNVRELANTLERAVALGEHDTIVPEDLLVPSTSPLGAPDFLDAAAARGLPMAELEQLYIQKVLQVCAGNKAQAARVLGMDRRTLYRKLEEEEEEGQPE